MTERSDKKKNYNKIVKSVVNNPLQSQREIAKETWLGKTTVQGHLKDLPKTTKDDRIKSLTDKDFKCIELWVLEIQRRLSDKEELEKMRTPEISQVIKENTARYTLFVWEATDEQGWAKDMSAIDKLNSVTWLD